MKALLICDPQWSTGNIAKCLIAALPHWDIEMHDWRTVYWGSNHDAVVCLSMSGAGCNQHWAKLRMAHVLCGPGELDLPYIAELKLARGVVLAGVSRECADLLRAKYTANSVHTTPGFPHPTVFTFRARPDSPIRRAGFVGMPTTQSMQVSGPAKRPEMFSEICAKAGIEAVFSEQRYRYEDMQKFYDSVDVVISTSTGEGGPFSPVEATACGVPALSTDVGIIRDMALPGRFFSAVECVDLIPNARALLRAQQKAVDWHTTRAISAWDIFLHHVAAVRLAHD